MEAAKHPVVFVRSLSQYRWSERTVIGLIMQTRDNSLHVNGTSGIFGAPGRAYYGDISFRAAQ